MTNIRRYYRRGNRYFVTSVTYERKPILIKHVDNFWNAVRKIQKEQPFDLLAWVLLPDHFHFLIDPGEFDLSSLMRRIKLTFSASCRAKAGVKRGRVWQHRFWDHVIRNQADMNNHIDYIHYNPVKHGLVNSPFRWGHSSFGEFVREGCYESDWGTKIDPTFDGEYGE